MSYTPPDPASFSATWAGMSAYSPPSAGEFSAAWGESGPPPAGYQASGFTSSNYGTPRYIAHVTQAAGWPVPAFGTAYATNAYRASGIERASRFGTPATPTFTSHQAQGFKSFAVGVPYGIQPFEFDPVNQATYADGWIASRFGVPQGRANFLGLAASCPPGQLGAPRLAIASFAEPIGSLVQFGAPTLIKRHRAAGFAVSQFGLAAGGIGYLVHGFSAPRFGTPRSRVPGALMARGWLGSRFGTPRARLLPEGFRAQGSSTTQFGGPVAYVVHRASSLGLPTRYGRPTLKRNPTC